MSDEFETIEGELTFAEIPVRIKGKDGLVRDYTLREMDGDHGDDYLNVNSKRAKFDAKGELIPGSLNFTGSFSSLLCRCMFDSDNKLVSEKVIQAFPRSLQKRLFEAAQKLNGLDAKAEEEAKND